MTIADAINGARVRRDTELPDEILLQWLNRLDGALWEDVCQNYEGAGSMPCYDEDTDIDGTELLVLSPYDDLYIDYLVMRIDLDHGDYERYNNDAALWESERRAWANWYNRTHRWLSTQSAPRAQDQYTHVLF